ncbi:MAG: universal stress protein [Candidatus Dormiibacterota bacterium]
MTISTASGFEFPSKTAPIVVGVDGSSSSHRALEWAVLEAEVHGNPVLAISTYMIPALMTAAPGFTFDPRNMEELADQCRVALASEIAAVSKGHPAVAIEPKVVQGPAALALIEASAAAFTLLVGSRGHGGFVGLLLGSVSQQCVSHARCPVVVIHPARRE